MYVCRFCEPQVYKHQNLHLLTLTSLPSSPNLLSNFPQFLPSLLATPFPPPVSGPQLLLQLSGGEMVTVESLLDEVYQKASSYRLWPLLRHTAGLLHKHVEDLAQVGSFCTVTVCMYIVLSTIMVESV